MKNCSFQLIFGGLSGFDTGKKTKFPLKDRHYWNRRAPQTHHLPVAAQTPHGSRGPWQMIFQHIVVIEMGWKLQRTHTWSPWWADEMIVAGRAKEWKMIQKWCRHPLLNTCLHCSKCLKTRERKWTSALRCIIVDPFCVVSATLRECWSPRPVRRRLSRKGVAREWCGIRRTQSGLGGPLGA